MSVFSFCQAFSMDVIASTVFGLQLDAQKDPNHPFNVMGKRLFDVPATSPVVLLFSMYPASLIMSKDDHLLVTGAGK